MNAAFMASDAVALPAMEVLRSAGLLRCVVSNPDRPKGRGRRLSPNPAAAWAIENGVPLLRPEETPRAECVEWMASFGVDCVIVMAYGRILRREILDFPKLGCLNLHGSLLPSLRGASPIETALALGMEKTGVTLMRIAPKMDAGDVCGAVETPVAPRETGASLRVKIARAAADLLSGSLGGISSASLRFEPQDESLATYSRKLSKDDARLDFSMSAPELDRRMRAFGGGIAKTDGEEIRIGEAFAEPSRAPGVPGEIISADSGGVRISCGDGVLRAVSLQAPCARMLPAGQFLNGRPLSPGQIFESFKNSPLLRTP